MNSSDQSPIDTEKKKMHQLFAVDCFNQAWRHLTKANDNAEEGELSLQCAYTSLWHWRFVGDHINQARGEWMISHVCALLRRSETAIHHAQRCLNITLNNDLKDFDLAYAYEAMARAHASAGNHNQALPYYRKAVEAGKNISETDDKIQFNRDLEDNNWFGLLDLITKA